MRNSSWINGHLSKLHHYRIFPGPTQTNFDTFLLPPLFAHHQEGTLVTLKEAHRLQKSFHTKYNNIICTHRGSNDQLLSGNGEDVGFWVCLICGSVYISRYQPLSPTELEFLEELAAQDG